MKCTCDECGGSGKVTCDGCDGYGTIVGNIEDMDLSSNLQNYDELVELQKDASRIQRDTVRLMELNPAHAKSYQEQLDATLLVINEQAEQIAKRKAA